MKKSSYLRNEIQLHAFKLRKSLPEIEKEAIDLISNKTV